MRIELTSLAISDHDKLANNRSMVYAKIELACTAGNLAQFFLFFCSRINVLFIYLGLSTF